MKEQLVRPTGSTATQRGRPRPAFRLTVAAVAAALFFALFGASGAQANYLVGVTGNGGSSCASGLNMMDPLDSSLHYRRSSLDSDVSSAVWWVMTYKVASPTDLTAVSTTSSEDATFYDYAYTTTCGKNWWSSGSGGVYGMATCRYKSGSTCTRHWVRISNTYTDQASTTEIRKLICHETGHVIGINHNSHSSPNSCLRSNSEDGTTGFSSHEIDDMIDWQW